MKLIGDFEKLEGDTMALNESVHQLNTNTKPLVE
jgi:hypothetical protein